MDWYAFFYFLQKAYFWSFCEKPLNVVQYSCIAFLTSPHDELYVLLCCGGAAVAILSILVLVSQAVPAAFFWRHWTTLLQFAGALYYQCTWCTHTEVGWLQFDQAVCLSLLYVLSFQWNNLKNNWASSTFLALYLPIIHFYWVFFSSKLTTAPLWCLGSIYRTVTSQIEGFSRDFFPDLTE